MSLKIYNSLTRQRETFEPLNPPRVGIYVCGPTVYGHSHLGHAKSYVSFDVVVRWLRALGHDVNYVQNITDVGHLTNNDEDAGEDPVIREARRRGLHPMAVAESYTRSFLDDMDRLSLVRPDIMPRATGHIPEQIELARALIAKGHAYEVQGSVYFSVPSFAEYGKLSGRSVEQMEAGARVAVNAEKQHPADFALWKHADASHLMRWPSPWGEGYPGWHLECSAMSMKYLGATVDIHGGGLENQFPHHECEIAQSECVTRAPFVRYWMHNNMVTLNGQKMGKSLGNAISLKEVFFGREGGVRSSATGELLLEKAYEPVVVRHFILTSHYRATLDFSSEALSAAESGSYKLRDALKQLTHAARHAPDAQSQPQRLAQLGEIKSRFDQAMNEDFNTAAAIAVLFELTRVVNGWMQESAARSDLLAAEQFMRHSCQDVLGLHWPATDAADAERPSELIRLLVDLRMEARQRKDFALSDVIRDRLKGLGVELKDGPQGTTW